MNSQPADDRSSIFVEHNYLAVQKYINISEICHVADISHIEQALEYIESDQPIMMLASYVLNVHTSTCVLYVCVYMHVYVCVCMCVLKSPDVLLIINSLANLDSIFAILQKYRRRFFASF